MKTLLAALTAHTAAAACLIHGTVVDATTGQPLAVTRTFVRPYQKPGSRQTLRLSDAKGAFRFDQLDAGVYELSAVRAGYLDAVYGARPGTLDGVEISVEGAIETPAVVLQMTRSASLAGTLSDAGGELLEGASVTLWHKIWNSNEHRWGLDEVTDRSTDDRGWFRFGQLPPGNYYVSAKERNDPGGLDEKGRLVFRSSPPIYFGGDYTFERATAIALDAGQDAGIAITIPPRTGGRSLTARLAPGVERGVNAELSAHGMQDEPRAVARIREDGTVSIQNLQPDRYWLLTSGVTPFIQVKVDLTDGDLEDVVLAPQPAYDVPVSLSGVPKGIRNVDLLAHESATGEFHRFRAREGQPTYVMNDLAAGVYWLETRGNDGYLKNLVIDGRSRPDTVLDLRSGPPVLVEAVFSTHLANISGRVESVPGRLKSTVVWANEERSTVEEVGDSVKAGGDGQFQLEKMPPGKYRLFAIEGFDPDLWGSLELAAALREKSVAVELQEDDGKRVILQLITAGEWEKALRKVGM